MAAIVAEAKHRGSRFSERTLTALARTELDRCRELLLAGTALNRSEIETQALEAILGLERPRLQPVLNATGVIIHTNLGRAPVSLETADAMRAAAASAVALEIDAETNDRGGRMREITRLFQALTGAEAALVVNNCASAVLLALAAVAADKSVIVSRGEAVEIGGGFRIPDVLRQSGALLVEVGTTNRTYSRDFAAATDEQTGAYLKVHPSNFRSFGFVHSPSARELAVLARERDIPLLEDLGSGALLDTSRFGLDAEPTMSDAVAAGVDLVMASGDKLLGGPQAGIILGRSHWVERVARHPLARAVRADKTCLAGLAATLRHYARDEAERTIPVWRMISASESSLQERAARLARHLAAIGGDVAVEPVQATIGGGSLPGESLPSWAIALSPQPNQAVDDLARRLRTGDPGVFGRVEHGRVILDLRTVLPEDDELIAAAMRGATR